MKQGPAPFLRSINPLLHITAEERRGVATGTTRSAKHTSTENRNISAVVKEFIYREELLWYSFVPFFFFTIWRCHPLQRMLGNRVSSPISLSTWSSLRRQTKKKKMFWQFCICGLPLSDPLLSPAFKWLQTNDGMWRWANVGFGWDPRAQPNPPENNRQVRWQRWLQGQAPTQGWANCVTADLQRILRGWSVLVTLTKEEKIYYHRYVKKTKKIKSLLYCQLKWTKATKLQQNQPQGILDLTETILKTPK